MDGGEDDEELKLAKVSAGLLANLEASIPKLFWKRSKIGTERGVVHTRIRKRDLDYVLKLIEPFQGEPQLLDARLKFIVPPLIQASVEWLALEASPSTTEPHIAFQTAVCTILYTLCKVRGSKVVVGFFDNEPRHLEPVLNIVEQISPEHKSQEAEWQVEYVLLLWLSHLLLTPFDLASISTEVSVECDDVGGLDLPAHIPLLAVRALRVGLKYLSSSSKTQDAAAALIVRLVNRPDMQVLRLADVLVDKMLQNIKDDQSTSHATMYGYLGPLQVLAGITTSADLGHLVFKIYQVTAILTSQEIRGASNAVAKKMTVKIMRNIAIFALRSSAAKEPGLGTFEATDVLEDVIDYLLRSVSDRDTPVRYAAAKAISLVVQELDTDMGYEVLQAVLDTFKEDMPAHGDPLDFRTADALKWHGLTLTLAHALFKRTASPEQTPDIVWALTSALQFEQRTATGSSMGTNVRDAANFGVWALSRRYTTEELLAVDMNTLGLSSTSYNQQSVIQHLAIELILSACTDPAGNIRRGSSAALQELVGRHPNQVYEGISLVQIVDYQAVSLRRRAMVDMAGHAAALNYMYWKSSSGAVLGWRGIGSADVPSREAAANCLADLGLLQPTVDPISLLSILIAALDERSTGDAEILHGLSLSLAHILQATHGQPAAMQTPQYLDGTRSAWKSLERLQATMKDFSSRTVRSELPAAVTQLLAALCSTTLTNPVAFSVWNDIPWQAVETITEHILSRFEDSILELIPSMVKALFAMKRITGLPLGCIDAQTLVEQVAADASKTTLHGAGRAIASGALVSLYVDAAHEEVNAVVRSLSSLIYASNVDRRVIGVRSLTLAVECLTNVDHDNLGIPQVIYQAAHQALNDYTIDERGDVGSLVRLQAITCAHSIISSSLALHDQEAVKMLKCDIVRLSLEKLDRVRLQAAQCKNRIVNSDLLHTDVASVSSLDYFRSALQPLRSQDCDMAIEQALLEGCISCAGASAESLLQASRQALAEVLDSVDHTRLLRLVTTYSTILRTSLADSNSTAFHPALELLAFLLDMQIPQRLARSLSFKWRNLLSTVQKSHHKSNDIPKILAAVHVYRSLAGIEVIRDEVMKKLIGMLRTNPYPRVRVAVAEGLWSITGEDMLKGHDWAAKRGVEKTLGELQERYVQ